MTLQASMQITDRCPTDRHPHPHLHPHSHLPQPLLRPLALAAVGALLGLAGCEQKAAPPASSASAGAASAPAAAAVEVPFGVAVPTSGGLGHIGKDVQNGVRMAIDEINATHPVIGGKTIAFKLLAEDDAGEPKQATAVAQKLCDLKAIAVVGHLQSGTTIPAAAIYNQCGIPQITPAATNPDLNRAGYDTLFRLIANDNQLGAAVAQYAVAKAGAKRVALLDDRTAFGQGLSKVFKEAAESKGATVVATEYTTDKATDFLAQLTAIKAKDADTILFGGLDAQAGPMLRQMQQLGMTKVRLVAGDGTCTEKLPELAAQAKTLENVICATGGASVGKLQGGADWLKRYEARFPGQFQIYGAYAYAATYVLVEAMKSADSTEPKTYLPKLAAINTTGLTGPVSFVDKGELAKPAVTIYSYRDNKRTEIEQ